MEQESFIGDYKNSERERKVQRAREKNSARGHQTQQEDQAKSPVTLEKVRDLR